MLVRIVLEYRDSNAEQATMRWERIAGEASLPGESPSENHRPGPAFELLGRAFEVAQREENASFDECLAAFFQGAMIQREDLVSFLAANPA